MLGPWWARLLEWPLVLHQLKPLFPKSLLDTFCIGAYSVHFLFKFVSRWLLPYPPASQITTLSRCLLPRVFKRSSYKEDLGIRGLCCRINSNDSIFEKGVSRISCRFRKFSGLRWRWPPLVCRANTKYYWCVFILLWPLSFPCLQVISGICGPTVLCI